MTTDELNAIVKAVMDEMEKAGVDFDFKAETPQADDLVYVMRGTADKYQGITVKWQNLLDIIVKKATDAKDEAVSAKDIAIQTLATIQGIENNVSTMKTSVETTKGEVETLKSDVSTMKASVETSEARVTQIKAEAEQTLAEATQTVSGKADKTYVDGELAKKADITYVDGKLANKADKSELAVERARIDSLSTLPEGSTTGDAELIDLRIGADGVTYGNAGNAVRTQFNDLKGDITSEYKLFEVSDLTQGAWYADGIHETPNRICISKLIPVKKGDKFTYQTDTLRVGFGLWVNGALQEYSDWVTAPSETTYIFQQDGDFFAQFSESNNANISPSSYDGISKLYTGIRYLVSQNANSIDSLRDEIGMHSYGCVVVNGTPQNVANTQCVYTSNKIPVKKGDHVSLKLERPLDSSASKYIFGVYGYNSSDSNIVNLSPTARASLKSDYIVDNANVAYIQYAITEMDGNGNVVSVRASSFAGYETTAYVDENSDFYSYSYSGDYIDVKQKKYNVSATNLKIPTVEQIGAGAPQGFAMYNGKAIQLYANPSKVAIVNMSDSSVVATMDGNVGHGNTIDFFNEFEDSSDIFPLALVADGISNEAYKVRIQTTGVTVKEIIKFPVEHCGYFVSTMLDKLNSIIYTIGYYENSYNTNSGSNKMVIAKWDYSNLASNEDGSVTPEFIESFYVPYFTTLQGPTFYNGKLFVVSSPALAVSDTNIYVIDPVSKRICSLITDFVENIKTSETEGLYFYDNGESIECYLKNGDSAMAFFMMTFKE